MKFLLSLAVLAAGVAAQTTSAAPGSGSSDDCLADYILTRCLQTEKPKAEACDATDYECQCAAYEAIATCYNNCPDDARAASARNQVSVYCARVTTSRTNTATRTPSSTMASTTSGSAVGNTATFSADVPGHTDAAGSLVRNTGGVFLGFAGAVAALL